MSAETPFQLGEGRSNTLKHTPRWRTGYLSSVSVLRLGVLHAKPNARYGRLSSPVPLTVRAQISFEISYDARQENAPLPPFYSIQTRWYAT